MPGWAESTRNPWFPFQGLSQSARTCLKPSRASHLPSSGLCGVGNGPLFAVINPLWCQDMDHLLSMDANRADRVI